MARTSLWLSWASSFSSRFHLARIRSHPEFPHSLVAIRPLPPMEPEHTTAVKMESGQLDVKDGGTSGINPSSIRKLLVDAITEHSTFFRLHVAAFTFIPLIFSGIFFASNGLYHISFLDSMFLCYSAMTVTGLSTINLSTLTTWQQFILYFLMMIGDLTIVSWMMVLIRKRFFTTHCKYVAEKLAKRRNPLRRAMSLRSRASFMQTISGPIGKAFKQQTPIPESQVKASPNNPNGTPFIEFTTPTPGMTLISNKEQTEEASMILGNNVFSSSPKSANIELTPITESHMLRSPLSEQPTIQSPRIGFALSTTISPRYYRSMMVTQDGRSLPIRGATMIRSRTHSILGHEHTKYRNFGGFPGPTELVNRFIKKTAPLAHSKLERTMSMNTHQTLQSSSVPWLNFDGLVVGRNSDFHTDTLTDEQLEDVGGAEYRALKLLSILVPSYFVLCQLFSVILFLPWLSSTHQYDEVFANQFRLVSKPWFAFFQVMGAYTGGGLSLVDLGMVPFDGAYLMIAALIFVILAGNHCLPIFLRLIIWTMSKVLPESSELQQGLSFLLDHPRRCFLYLFPSHQTWFLVILLILFSIVEWVSFLVLNIGLPAYDSIPVGSRIISGFFQGLAARASGFAIAPIANLAPALQFLYVVMMYIAVYPIALSIRSTNVYEERSLGVFEAPPDDEDEEPQDLDKIPSSRERIGRYIDWHLRRQLSIDIWWLVWAVFLVAIIERGNLLDESKKWFDIFRILFELVSAFGGIGLSLGIPTENFAFSGALHPLSKLVVIVIMVRGRHRGLPVAVDRAVLLPNELVTDDPKAKPEVATEEGPAS